MAVRVPRHRGILIAVHAMILATMIALFTGLGTFTHVHPGVWIPLLIVPGMAVVWSVMDIERKSRILGYWALAMLMGPLAVLGLLAGWGLLYIIGILFLLWAAWIENEGR